MKILVIFTGGTIGSTVKNGWVSTDEGTKYALLEGYKGGADFETASPYTVLSENLSSSELNALQQEVLKSIPMGYDGIIVTHGTDTLQYSAAALEYAVGNCGVPIVLVSSDYPLENEISNGNINFEAAVEFIKQKAGAGVFVSYKNDNESFVTFHAASRILQHGECNANLYSIDGKSYGVYLGGKITLTGLELPEVQSGLGAVTYTKESGILVAESHPGNSYGYSLEGVRAIILKPYHSATLDTASKNLAAFCGRAKALGIPLFIAGVKTGVGYESAKLFEALGIITLPYSTHISAYMKIWAGLSLGCDVKEFVKKPVAREIVE